MKIGMVGLGLQQLMVDPLGAGEFASCPSLVKRVAKQVIFCDARIHVFKKLLRGHSSSGKKQSNITRNKRGLATGRTRSAFLTSRRTWLLKAFNRKDREENPQSSQSRTEL